MAGAFPSACSTRAEDPPASGVVAQHVRGDFKDADAVADFGAECDVLTIEIEHVSIEGMERVRAAGIPVHPSPEVLRTIQDKGLQKTFFEDQGLPTSPFALYPDRDSLRQAVASGARPLPFVQKSRTAGYDGRGVKVVRTEADLEELLPGACLAEDLVGFDREIAVIVARSTRGEVVAYPAVEMDFDPVANLVQQLICPARLSPEVADRARDLALRTAEALEITGLLAVEMFQTGDEVVINEVAPRPHNSGHQTIEGCQTSQFEQHVRAILGLPLGSTAPLSHSVMVNLLGADGHTGPPRYHGLTEALTRPGLKLHLYGKTETRPFRKMGHVTIVGDRIEDILEVAEWVRENVRVTT